MLKISVSNGLCASLLDTLKTYVRKSGNIEVPSKKNIGNIIINLWQSDGLRVFYPALGVKRTHHIVQWAIMSDLKQQAV